MEYNTGGKAETGKGIRDAVFAVACAGIAAYPGYRSFHFWEDKGNDLGAACVGGLCMFAVFFAASFGNKAYCEFFDTDKVSEG